MKKTLAALAFGAGLLLNSNVTLADEDYNPSQKLSQILKSKDFLNERGLTKSKYLVQHYFVKDEEGIPHYMKKYYLAGIPLIEVYDLEDKDEVNNPDSISRFYDYPSKFLFGDIGFVDPYKDGFNGNERLSNEPQESDEEKIKLLKISLQ